MLESYALSDGDIYFIAIPWRSRFAQIIDIEMGHIIPCITYHHQSTRVDGILCYEIEVMKDINEHKLQPQESRAPREVELRSLCWAFEDISILILS